MTNKLYCMIGLPRSGKSTVCQQWLFGDIDILAGKATIPKFDFTNTARVVVEDDAIRRAITGDRYNGRCESQVFAIKYGMIRTLMEQGYDVLVDDTHTSDESLIRLLEINKDLDFCFLNTSPEKCMSRAKETRQDDLKPVIMRQYDNLCQIIDLYMQAYDGFPAHKNCCQQIQTHINDLRQKMIARTEYNKRI